MVDIKDMERGKDAEQRFASLYENPVFSTPEEDMHEHWDVKVDGMKIDVKSIKKIKRTDEKPNENFHYVELRNVMGEKGWLYGDADAFAFETEDYWVIVHAEDLRQMIAEKVEKVKVKTSAEALYKFFNRKERKDLITLVKTIDLLYIALKIKRKDGK